MAEVAQGAPSPENPNTTMRISPQPPKPSAIRSRQSRYPVTIFFFNASSSHVSVQWVNYEGVALFWRRVDPSVAAVPWRERWRYLPRPRLARTPARTPAQGAVAAAVEAVGQGVDGKAAEGSSSFGQYFVTQDNEMALVIDKRNVKPAEYPVTIRRPALVAWSPATHTQFLDPLFRAQVKTLLLCYKRGCRMAAEHAVALGEQSPLASVTKGKQVVHADTMASSGGDKPHRRSRSSSPGGSPPLAIWLGMLPYELVISIIAAASPFALVGHWPGSEEWGKKASMANLALSGCYRCQ
eukprot:jgi/Mesvir1/1925/Mv22953-RA.2